MPGIGITGGRFSSGGGGSASITIGVFSDAGLTNPITSADFGDTVYINLTTSIASPTEYRFLIFESSVIGNYTLQAGATLSYTISSFNNLIVFAESEDGVSVAAALTPFELTINADVDANAYINAHNTASGLTMGVVQQEAIQGLFQRLKGVGTTYGSDLWSLLLASNSEIYSFCPVDDSTVSIPAYAIDLVNPSIAAVWNGFIPTDYTVTGVTGGVGKYLAMKRSPSDFGQNNIGIHVYSRTTVAGLSNTGIGASSAGDISGNRAFVFVSTNYGYYAANDTPDNLFNTSTLGLISAQRIVSTSKEKYLNGVLVNIASVASTTPTTNKFYGFANNGNGTASRALTGCELALIAATCSFTINEMYDFYEAIQYYQTNVITGGRNV